LFRPQWWRDFLGLLPIAPVNWASPTIGGLLSFMGVTEVMRYLVIALLPVAWFLARPQATVAMETSVALLTLITIPTTVFGWSYDQSLLLIPLAQWFGWLVSSPPSPRKSILATLAGLALAVNWYQRVVGANEVYYVWVPIYWAAIYAAQILIARPVQQRPTAQNAVPV
jgi:hypothetical protein